METKDIIANNALIAEFMGAGIYSNDKDYYYIPNMGLYKKDTIEIGCGKVMKYHRSFDWLISVVEKIESLNITPLYGKEWLRFSVTIEHSFCKIEHLRLTGVKIIAVSVSDSNSKIEAVYNAVIEFIKWYNENK